MLSRRKEGKAAQAVVAGSTSLLLRRGWSSHACDGVLMGAGSVASFRRLNHEVQYTYTVHVLSSCTETVKAFHFLKWLALTCHRSMLSTFPLGRISASQTGRSRQDDFRGAVVIPHENRIELSRARVHTQRECVI